MLRWWFTSEILIVSSLPLVAGQSGALANRSNGVWSLVSSNAGWSGGGAACVATAAGGGVLIGTRDKGVFSHQNGVMAPLALNQHLTNLFIRSLYPCTNGGLWIALSSFVARFQPRDGKVQHFPLPAGASDVRTFVQDASGDLWMGTTSDGLLLRVHGETLINETTNIMPEPRHIRCLQVTSDGNLWFGFAGQGLGLLKNGRFFQFRSGQGLWDDYISQVLPDDRGRLWIAGNRGIFQVDRAELEAVAAGLDSRMRSVVFGRGEGVANVQATFGICRAATRTKDGHLLMPMLTVLVMVEPQLLRRKPLPPPVVIERLTVNGQVAAAYDRPTGSGFTQPPSPANLHVRSRSEAVSKFMAEKSGPLSGG